MFRVSLHLSIEVRRCGELWTHLYINRNSLEKQYSQISCPRISTTEVMESPKTHMYCTILPDFNHGGKFYMLKCHRGVNKIRSNGNIAVQSYVVPSIQSRARC
uniref:Uncharacterized protein n=1 Tax=Cacopsylla melanoneura TaxID=428564 RepID=A0A8D8VB04_9HEMI